MLFGGDMVVKHLDWKVVVDEWIELAVAAQSGAMFQQLRGKLDAFLQLLIKNPDMPRLWTVLLRFFWPII